VPAQEAARALALLREYLVERRPRDAERLRILPLSGDASTRRYYRLTNHETRYVFALYPEPFEAEGLPFLVVQRLLADYGLPAPAVVDVDGPRGIVLQQDLGDRTLQEALRECEPDRAATLVREAVHAIVRLQREAARGPQQAECFRVAFDLEKLSWELHYFAKHFLEGLRSRELTAEDRATLAESFHGLSQEIASWPRVLCHRDYHSRNLMPHNGQLYWIDFQDARMGPNTYDLASLLRDAYVDVAEELQEELLEGFRREVAPQEPPAAFRRRYDLTCVQRNLKALGTFGFMSTVRRSAVYLPYIPRTLAHARRNLSRYPELHRLWRTLARHVPELD
jgi:hypothetical protein